MQRVTITIDDDLLGMIDALCDRRGYQSRSEAVRDLVRDAAARERSQADDARPCFATLTYVFEHETRELARRLTKAVHEHHDLSVSSLHVHVNKQDCLEVAVLKGRVGEVQLFADSIISQRGVRSGKLHVIPLDNSDVAGLHDHAHPHDK